MANSTSNKNKYKVIYQVADGDNTDIKLVDSNMSPFISTAELIEVFGYLSGIVSNNSEDFRPNPDMNNKIFCDDVTITSILQLLNKSLNS